MRPTAATLRLIAFGLLVALALAVGSFGLQRHGPEYGVFGNLCGPEGDQFCYRPLLNAGWPLGYVFDTPGVSVEEKLHLEDRFRLLPFVIDVLFYFALLAIAARFGRARRRLRSELRLRRDAYGKKSLD